VPCVAADPDTGGMSATNRASRASHGRRAGLYHAGGWVTAAAAAAALLAACGGSSAATSTAGNTSSGGGTTSASPAVSAAPAAGGSMGCLTGAWRSNSISDPQLGLSGGAGGTLTVSGTGAFTINYGDVQPMKFHYHGVKGSMRYSGQASGELRVRGDKLSGVTRSSTFAVRSTINGVSFNVPLPKVSPGASVPWQTFSCSGNTLTLVNKAPAPSWSMTRTG
jgi:hypothetical protein